MVIIMKTGLSQKINTLANYTVKGIPLFFWALFAICILWKSKLFLTPVSLLPAALIAVLVFCSKYKQEKWILWLIVIFAAAFAARLLFIRIWPMTPMSDAKMEYEFSEQLSNASVRRWHELFAANTYYYDVWCMHVPHVVYTVICMRLLGNNVFSLQVVNMLFSSLTCVFAAMCGEGLSGSKRAGILAGLFMAFHTTTLFMACFLVNQHVSTCFFLASMYLIIKQPFKSEAVNFVISGILLATGQLMRPEMYIVVIAVFCMFIYDIITKAASKERGLTKKDAAMLAGRFLCFLVSFFVVMGIANAALLRLGWVNNSILESKLEYKFMIGLNQETEGRFQESDYPLAADDEAVKELLQERLSGPVDTATLMIKKLCFQFSSYNYWWLQAEKGGNIRQYVIDHIFEPLTQSYMFIVFLFYLAASVRSFKIEDRRLALLNIILTGYLCAFALMEVQQRYAYITIPVVVILASLFFRSDDKKLSKQPAEL